MFTENYKIIVAGAAIGNANNTDSNSTRIDMTGWDGVVFIAPVDDSAATGTAKLTVEQNTADSDTGMTALTGATYTATCAVNDDLNSKAIVVDVYRPLERYVQGVRVSAVANIAFGDLIAILYKGKSLPFTSSSTLLGKVAVAGPAEV
jgi:hypothetical protein